MFNSNISCNTAHGTYRNLDAVVFCSEDTGQEVQKGISLGPVLHKPREHVMRLTSQAVPTDAGSQDPGATGSSQDHYLCVYDMRACKTGDLGQGPSC